MHASILNQMDLLATRYDELSTELSKCVRCARGRLIACIARHAIDLRLSCSLLRCTRRTSNDGSFSSDKITKLSIEMADLEPKVMAVKELRAKQAAVLELDEVRIVCVSDSRSFDHTNTRFSLKPPLSSHHPQMIAEQTGETDPDAIELRVMAEDERRELLEEITELEATVTVSSLSSSCCEASPGLIRQSRRLTLVNIV